VRTAPGKRFALALVEFMQPTASSSACSDLCRLATSLMVRLRVDGNHYRDEDHHAANGE
jgi:hypothetical protein